ncbi:molybdopterin converting factor subunit 1 [Pseudomonas aeruginosa]|nr:molybdopterin converting factor subunit 1 [Pseudomonas aeruginosa]
MIRVQYFARYREALGVDGEQLNWDAGLATLGALRQLLVERGGAWERTLGEQNLMCARNQELCGLDEPLQDGDEVAFFPAVTGG